MKVRVNRVINEKNLTLEQVMSRFIKGHVTGDWYAKISILLQALSKDGGAWIYPNARLKFIRTDNDEYTVTTI